MPKPTGLRLRLRGWGGTDDAQVTPSADLDALANRLGGRPGLPRVGLPLLGLACGARLIQRPALCGGGSSALGATHVTHNVR